MADYVPNMLRCAKCNFELERLTLNANTGEVGIGTNDPERCPNGCGPLWRVTWEQEARYLGARMNEWADRAIAAEGKLAVLTSAPPPPQRPALAMVARPGIVNCAPCEERAAPLVSNGQDHPKSSSGSNEQTTRGGSIARGDESERSDTDSVPERPLVRDLDEAIDRVLPAPGGVAKAPANWRELLGEPASSSGSDGVPHVSIGAREGSNSKQGGHE